MIVVLLSLPVSGLVRGVSSARTTFRNLTHNLTSGGCAGGHGQTAPSVVYW